MLLQRCSVQGTENGSVSEVLHPAITRKPTGAFARLRPLQGGRKNICFHRHAVFFTQNPPTRTPGSPGQPLLSRAEARKSGILPYYRYAADRHEGENYRARLVIVPNDKIIQKRVSWGY